MANIIELEGQRQIAVLSPNIEKFRFIYVFYFSCPKSQSDPKKNFSKCIKTFEAAVIDWFRYKVFTLLLVLFFFSSFSQRGFVYRIFILYFQCRLLFILRRMIGPNHALLDCRSIKWRITLCKWCNFFSLCHVENWSKENVMSKKFKSTRDLKFFHYLRHIEERGVRW